METENARIGKNFHEEIEQVKKERLKSGVDKKRISTGRITNLIIKHKLWKEVIRGELLTYKFKRGRKNNE